MAPRNSGRVNVVVLAALICVALLTVVVAFSRQSVTAVGAKFMSALAKGDVATLTEMSYLGSTPKERMREKWEYATKTVAPHYLFLWKIVGSAEPTKDEATVRLQVNRNAGNPGTYEENFQLPLKKEGGEWKVDVRAISRDMYPGLPR